MNPFVDRMIRAAKLDVHVYEEVEADKSAMKQAMGVVVLSSLAGGIGFMQAAGLTGLLIGTVVSLIGWYLWAFLTYIIGTKQAERDLSFFGEESIKRWMRKVS